MPDRVYRYTTATAILLCLFLLVWSIPWLFMSYTNRQPVQFHGADGIRLIPAWTTYLTGIVGFPVLALGIRLGGTILFERVVITVDDQLLWFDWRGREALRTTVKRVTAVDGLRPQATKEDVYTITVRTLDGNFKFSNMLRGWKELAAALS